MTALLKGISATWKDASGYCRMMEEEADAVAISIRHVAIANMLLSASFALNVAGAGMRNNPMPIQTTTITVDILRETDDAILVTDSATEVWLPKGQLESWGDPGDKAVEIELPEWLAEKKGLI